MLQQNKVLFLCVVLVVGSDNWGNQALSWTFGNKYWKILSNDLAI